MSGEGEGFLSRWSRRKRAATAVPAATPPAAPAPPDSVPPDAAPAPDAAARPAFDPASLPPLDSLTAESDFAAFLREEVPAALRRAALRRAWTLDPAIRDFVGPAEYAWDYNAPGGVPGFSLEAPADLERLIAQAIGSSPPAEGARGEEAPVPVETAADAAVDGVAAPAPEPAAIEAPPAQDAPSLAASADEEAAPATPADAPPPPAVEAPAARRRHGGALPS